MPRDEPVTRATLPARGLLPVELDPFVAPLEDPFVSPAIVAVCRVLGLQFV